MARNSDDILHNRTAKNHSASQARPAHSTKVSYVEGSEKREEKKKGKINPVRTQC